MSTEIFKVGDPVFDIRYGWGNVLSIVEKFINVQFKDIHVYNKSDLLILSFTEYDLINGGWSQDRSVLNQPKRGDLVYVKKGYNEWEMRFFSHKGTNGLFYCFANQLKTGNVYAWDQLKLENPLLKEKE